jgi:hypothetical protein
VAAQRGEQCVWHILCILVSIQNFVRAPDADGSIRQPAGNEPALAITE